MVIVVVPLRRAPSSIFFSSIRRLLSPSRVLISNDHFKFLVSNILVNILEEFVWRGWMSMTKIVD